MQARHNTYLANKERHNIQGSKWREANKAAIKEQKRQEYIANREYIKQRSQKSYYLRRSVNLAGETKKRREWKEKNPQRVRLMKDRFNAHRRADPQRRAEEKGRRRARIKGNGFEKISYKEILQRDGYKCHICRKAVAKADLSFDHLIPIAKGGPHVTNNIAVAHRRCNYSMGAGRYPAQLLLKMEASL